MPSKTKLFVTLALTLSISWAIGQERRVIVHKKVLNADSLHDPFNFEHDLEFEIFDSLKNHFTWSHDGVIDLLGDSSRREVFIHRAPMHERKAARIVIKKSGFFRKSKIVIDFDPMNQAIIKVLDNDQEVPLQKFHKYQKYLEDATEFAELEALHPRMEELEFKMQSLQLADSEKMADLEALLIDLEKLESGRAHLKREHYSSIKKVIKLENLEKVFQEILENAGMTPPQKLETIAIKKGKFYINGEEIEGDVGKKCIQAYMSNSNLNSEDLEMKGEEISIQIKFD